MFSRINGTSNKSTGSSILRDLLLAELASLLSVLTVEHCERLSGLLRSGGGTVWKWLALSCAGMLLGGLVSGYWKPASRSYGMYWFGRLLSGVIVKEIAMAAGLLAGFIGCPGWGWGVFVILLDISFTVDMLVLSRYAAFCSRNRRGSSASNPRTRNAVILGTGDESVSLADEIEAMGRYHVVGYLTADRSKEGMSIGGRPVFWFQDASDLDSLFWRVRGIDNILVPQEWSAALGIKRVMTDESGTFI